MQELRGYSTRAEITPASFVNEYSYGSFKGDASEWMNQYFDAHLYFANWGTHELHLRIPSTVLPLKLARRYCSDDNASVRANGNNLIFTFRSEDECMSAWVASLPISEKDALLLRLMEGSEPHLGMQLLRRFKDQTGGDCLQKEGSRTAGELLAAAEARSED